MAVVAWARGAAVLCLGVLGMLVVRDGVTGRQRGAGSGNMIDIKILSEFDTKLGTFLNFSLPFQSFLPKGQLWLVCGI